MATGTSEPPDFESDEHGGDSGAKGMNSSYWRFGAMIATSTVVMFILTYTNSWAFSSRAVE